MKTAVEWLFAQMSNILAGYETELNQSQILEQAKEMEKEQIVNAHFDGCEIGEIFAYENRAFITDSEQYYNNTFKK